MRKCQLHRGRTRSFPCHFGIHPACRENRKIGLPCLDKSPHRIICTATRPYRLHAGIARAHTLCSLFHILLRYTRNSELLPEFLLVCLMDRPHKQSWQLYPRIFRFGTRCTKADRLDPGTFPESKADRRTGRPYLDTIPLGTLCMRQRYSWRVA